MRPRGLPSGCSARASHCSGFCCWRAHAHGACASAAEAHRLSCSSACGVFPDQGSNPRPLHWQADCLSLDHQGSPISGSWVTVIFNGSKRCSKNCSSNWNNHQLAKTNKINFIGIPKATHKLASTRGLKERAGYFWQESSVALSLTCIPSPRMVAVAVWVLAKIAGTTCLCQGSNTDLVLQLLWLYMFICLVLPWQSSAEANLCFYPLPCTGKIFWEGIMTVQRIKDKLAMTVWARDGEWRRWQTDPTSWETEGRGWRLTWEQGLGREGGGQCECPGLDACSRKVPEDPRLTPWVALWAACKQEVKIMAERWVAQAGPQIESQPEPNSPHWERVLTPLLSPSYSWF